jgi:hypothetical protein
VVVPSEHGVLVTFGDSGTCLRATQGDLRLGTPNGTLRLRAHTDIDCQPRGALRVHALRSVTLGTAAAAELVVRPSAVRLAAARIAACVRTVSLTTDELRLRGRSLALFGGRIALRVERLERSCRRAVERVGELSRLLAEGDCLRAGRVRLFARGSVSVDALGLRLTSDESSDLDGRQIFVG